MSQYPLQFSDLKSKVGIDDIAFSLGYCLDKKAGVGKYIELVLGDPRNPTDKIVVRNTPDKARQFYFRRDGSKGDVVSFVKENINSFNVSGASDWVKAINALAKFANMPTVDLADREYVRSQSSTSKTFDPSRYETQPIGDKIPYILKTRGFSDATIAAFDSSVVMIKDKCNKNYDGFNIGFPYTNPQTMALTGFEIRGNKGFKSKASGTDSANSAWIAEFPKETPNSIRNVYFFESGFDAMAFYQVNRAKLSNMPFALVSVGGSFNGELMSKIMSRFPAARAWDCFDNDIAGQMYSASLVSTVDKVDLSIDTKDDMVNVMHGEKNFQCRKEEFCFSDAAESLGITYSTGHWKSPRNYKDWNDCLLGKQIEPELSPSKYTRDENLAQRRQSTLKL